MTKSVLYRRSERWKGSKLCEGIPFELRQVLQETGWCTVPATFHVISNVEEDRRCTFSKSQAVLLVPFHILYGNSYFSERLMCGALGTHLDCLQNSQENHSGRFYRRKLTNVGELTSYVRSCSCREQDAVSSRLPHFHGPDFGEGARHVVGEMKGVRSELCSL
jgi:hypothetical protein